jgi:hypothetical protein
MWRPAVSGVSSVTRKLLHSFEGYSCLVAKGLPIAVNTSPTHHISRIWHETSFPEIGQSAPPPMFQTVPLPGICFMVEWKMRAHGRWGWLPFAPLNSQRKNFMLLQRTADKRCGGVSGDQRGGGEGGTGHGTRGRSLITRHSSLAAQYSSLLPKSQTLFLATHHFSLVTAPKIAPSK